MEDETGSGPLEFRKLTPEMHVQQLMIDLHNAHEENKQLREDLARALEKARMTFSHLCLVAIVTAFVTHTVWLAFSFASK